MLFGQSLFQSVLDRLDAEEDKSEKDEAAHRIRGLNVSFAARRFRPGISTILGAHSRLASKSRKDPLIGTVAAGRIPESSSSSAREAWGRSTWRSTSPSRSASRSRCSAEYAHKGEIVARFQQGSHQRVAHQAPERARRLRLRPARKMAAFTSRWSSSRATTSRTRSSVPA